MFLLLMLLVGGVAQRGANIASNWNTPAAAQLNLALRDYSSTHNTPVPQPIVLFNGCVHGTCDSSRIIPAPQRVLLHNGCVHGNCDSSRWGWV